jgi:hypothetical protein
VTSHFGHLKDSDSLETFGVTMTPHPVGLIAWSHFTLKFVMWIGPPQSGQR